MRVISWNTNARSRRVDEQVAFLRKRRLDLIALQEVTLKSAPLFRAQLRECGFEFAYDSFELFRNPSELKGPRRYGVMIASKYPARLIRRKMFSVPWKEKILSVTVDTPDVSFDFHTTYVPPGSSNGWIKVETLEGIYEGFSGRVERPRILCGDFNIPQMEFSTGEIVTWAQRIRENGEVVLRKRFRHGDGARWDAAERNIMTRLAEYDLPDVYRLLRGWKARGASWYPIRKKGTVVGRRFDHIFASNSLNASGCRYIDNARRNGLSDHSPVVAEFELCKANS